jgi:UDP-N-acetylenolpyruvoylglucosamine reductase
MSAMPILHVVRSTDSLRLANRDVRKQTSYLSISGDGSNPCFPEASMRRIVIPAKPLSDSHIFSNRGSKRQLFTTTVRQ